jgi:hypothetical protein
MLCLLQPFFMLALLWNQSPVAWEGIPLWLTAPFVTSVCAPTPAALHVPPELEADEGTMETESKTVNEREQDEREQDEREQDEREQDEREQDEREQDEREQDGDEAELELEVDEPQEKPVRTPARRRAVDREATDDVAPEAAQEPPLRLPRYFTQLDLQDEQREQMAILLRDYRVRMEALREHLQTLEATQAEELRELLTPSQARKLDRLERSGKPRKSS